MSALDRLFARLEKVVLWLAVIAAGVMMFLTSGDALMRYLFNSPIIGAYELTEKFFMPMAIFLGFAYAYRGGAFIRVTFLIDRLPPSLRVLANYLAWAVAFITCALFLYATLMQALNTAGDDTKLGALPILLWPAYFIPPAGFFLICALMLIDLPRVGSGDAMIFSQDAPTA